MRTTIRYRAAVVLATFLAAFALGASGAHAQGEPARGTISIEDLESGEPTQLTDDQTENEVKVGCDFRVDFFGFATEEVPVTFELMDPTGDAGTEIEARTASLEEAQGNEPSGSLPVDLTEDLRGVEPAQSEDFDYKIRVEAVVKETGENDNEVTKSAILFLACDVQAAQPVEDEEPVEEDETPAGAVPAGMGGAAGAQGSALVLPVGLALLAVLASLGLFRAYLRR